MNTKILGVALGILIAFQSSHADDPVKRVRSGHNLLEDGSLINAGVAVPGLTFFSVDRQPIYLDQVLQQGPAAFVFLSTKCPLAKRYTMRLRRLHQELSDDGAQLFAVFPNSDESDDGIKQYVMKADFPFPCVRDINGYLVNRLGATMTPQAFVVDENSIIRYCGAIDDHRYENRVQHRYLRDALLALLSGKPVETPSTTSMGCSIHLTSSTGEGEVTYSSHIARILQDNCQTCHRDGQVAPFAIESYDDAVRWKTEIVAYTKSRLMPPWKASPAVGHFSNDLSLSDEEIELIAQWVQQGTPEGNLSDMPPAPKFNDDWAEGEPDLVIEMPEEYAVAPEGEDDYRHFIIPYEAGEHRFVESVDVRPGNPSVVHHVIAYVDTSGKARELDAADPGPGYTRFGDVGFKPASILGGWAPGTRPYKTPLGSGRWLPKKCDIVLQVHYYRTGFEERDRTKVGVYFSKSPRPVPTRLAVAINRDFRIPKDVKNHPVSAECEIEEDSYLYAITPHMHLVGETMSVTAHLPDGGQLPLIRIDDWDFSWQTTYRYRDLQRLPAGTRIELAATFDNSAENPNNPNSPPKEIAWGEKTTDEMCIAFLGLVRQSEYAPILKDAEAKGSLAIQAKLD